MNDKERAIALFEENGEAWVREQYETRRFTEFEDRLASHWLSDRDREARKASDAAAMVFAETASRSARTANRIAVAALAVAIISAGLGIWAIYAG
jgi:hypothetical protein